MVPEIVVGEWHRLVNQVVRVVSLGSFKRLHEFMVEDYGRNIVAFYVRGESSQKQHQIIKNAH